MLTLVEQAQAAGIAFRAVMADSAYGENASLEAALFKRTIPFVPAHRGRVGQGWALVEDAYSFEEAIEDLPKRAWKKVRQKFLDGRIEVWWAAEPDKASDVEECAVPGAEKNQHPRAALACWLRALQRVRAWLTPWKWLTDS